MSELVQYFGSNPGALAVLVVVGTAVLVMVGLALSTLDSGPECHSIYGAMMNLEDERAQRAER